LLCNVVRRPRKKKNNAKVDHERGIFNTIWILFLPAYLVALTVGLPWPRLHPFHTAVISGHVISHVIAQPCPDRADDNRYVYDIIDSDESNCQDHVKYACCYPCTNRQSTVWQQLHTKPFVHRADGWHYFNEDAIVSPPG